MKNLFWGLVLCLLVVSCKKEPQIRIACVGDSLTTGYLLEDSEKDSYPSVLQRLVGDTCEVKNFGIVKRTVLNKGDYPYMKDQIFNDALSYNPNIVVIVLGTNDSSPENMEHKEDFVNDLTEMVKSFQQLKTSPKVYLCLPTHAFSNFSSRDSIFTNIIKPYIEEVSLNCGTELVDIHTPLADSTLYSDGIHPNKKGAQIIAEEVYKKIKENLN